MENILNKIQMVINTLDGGLDLPTTYKNCATLAACINYLCEARDELKKGDKDGSPDSE